MKYVDEKPADFLQAPRRTLGSSRSLIGLLIIAGFGLLVLGCGSGGSGGSTESANGGNGVDVDVDNDGLIEIATDIELHNVRYNLAGTSYKTSDSDSGSKAGAPTIEPPACDDEDDETNRTLCGYELTADIDLSDIDGSGTDSRFRNWLPIGGASDSNQFSAIFEGNGNAITGIDSRGSYVAFGFFGVVASEGTVRNLHIAGRIRSTLAEPLLSGIGGLAGFNFGSIEGCSTTVTLTGDDSSGADNDNIGGLVGLSTGSIINSWSRSTIISGMGTSTDDSIGGLVGGLSGGTLRNSWSNAEVTGSSTSLFVGGLVGLIDALEGKGGDISDSYAIGRVTGGGKAESIGGLVGSVPSGSSVSDSYATGGVTGGLGEDKIGGLIGSADGTVTNSFYSGTVTTEGSETATAADTMQTEAALKTGASGIYDDWNSNSWDFGTASQFPALRSFVDNNNDGDNADSGEEGVLLCGQPGQQDTTPTRATRTECTEK